MTMLHKHRILPGHMGGTYAPENVILLTVSEHAEAHHQLFLEHGRWQDERAWKILSGQLDRTSPPNLGHKWTEEMKRMASVRGNGQLGKKRGPYKKSDKPRGRNFGNHWGAQFKPGNQVGVRFTPGHPYQRHSVGA